ncbi:hypothetical protein Tco_0186692 [Tanacetum coccineum]
MVTTSSKEILKEAKVRRENFKVAIHLNFPDQEVAIRGTLSAKGRTELCSLLKENLDIFAWIFACPTEEKGSGPETCQSQPGGGTETSRGGNHERNLLSRLAVQSSHGEKHDGSWWMCVDFTDLNKACPQNCYPLLKIDWKVKSLCGYPYKCFLDAYKGYHQIQIAESDEEKTAFHTIHGVYCYTKMPFGLKNTGGQSF